MTSPDFSDAQQLDSFVPVYDAVPDKWDDARPFIVEQLKRISNAVNIRLTDVLISSLSSHVSTMAEPNRPPRKIPIFLAWVADLCHAPWGES